MIERSINNIKQNPEDIKYVYILLGYIRNVDRDLAYSVWSMLTYGDLKERWRCMSSLIHIFENSRNKTQTLSRMDRLLYGLYIERKLTIKEFTKILSKEMHPSKRKSHLKEQ
jgi:hypothetical protein